jgi:hypothetical protein
VDIAYATGESAETTQNILSRLSVLQDAVFTNPTADCWIILSLSYDVPKRGSFRDSFVNEVWERWCIPFAFQTLTAHEIREFMLHTITQITQKATESEIPTLPPGAVFKFARNLPTDKDLDSKAVIDLCKRIVKTPGQILP